MMILLILMRMTMMLLLLMRMILTGRMLHRRQHSWPGVDTGQIFTLRWDCRRLQCTLYFVLASTALYFDVLHFAAVKDCTALQKVLVQHTAAGAASELYDSARCTLLTYCLGVLEKAAAAGLSTPDKLSHILYDGHDQMIWLFMFCGFLPMPLIRDTDQFRVSSQSHQILSRDNCKQACFVSTVKLTHFSQPCPCSSCLAQIQPAN